MWLVFRTKNVCVRWSDWLCWRRVVRRTGGTGSIRSRRWSRRQGRSSTPRSGKWSSPTRRRWASPSPCASRTASWMPWHAGNVPKTGTVLLCILSTVQLQTPLPQPLISAVELQCLTVGWHASTEHDLWHHHQLPNQEQHVWQGVSNKSWWTKPT